MSISTQTQGCITLGYQHFLDTNFMNVHMAAF